MFKSSQKTRALGKACIQGFCGDTQQTWLFIRRVAVKPLSGKGRINVPLHKQTYSTVSYLFFAGDRLPSQSLFLQMALLIPVTSAVIPTQSYKDWRGTTDLLLA